MASLKDRVTAAVARLRERYPWLDHVVRMVQHYGAVNGNAQAGAVTYFGFLSFFPILALGFFVIGLLAQLYPDIKDQMVAEINKLLPGVIGPDPGQIQLSHDRVLRGQDRARRPGRRGVRRPRLALGHAAGPRGDVRGAPAGAAELPDRQAARPRDAGAGRA